MGSVICKILWKQKAPHHKQVSVIGDTVFELANDTLDSNLKSLAKRGTISFTKLKPCISREDIEILYQKGQLGRTKNHAGGLCDNEDCCQSWVNGWWIADIWPAVQTLAMFSAFSDEQPTVLDFPEAYLLPFKTPRCHERSSNGPHASLLSVNKPQHNNSSELAIEAVL